MPKLAETRAHQQSSSPIKKKRKKVVSFNIWRSIDAGEWIIKLNQAYDHQTKKESTKKK